MSGILSGCREEIPKKLDVYVWKGYLPEEAAALFEQETGIKLNINLISDNDKLTTLLKGGGIADIIMPSQSYIGRFYTAGLVQPLDLKVIKNYKNVSKSLREQSWSKWDGRQMGAGEIYAVPYIFGTNGFVINTDKYTKNIDNIGWDVLFDNDLNKRASSKNGVTSILLILDLLGIPRENLIINTSGTLTEIRGKATELKNNSLKFWSTGSEIIDLMKNEEVWVSEIQDGGGRELSQFNAKFKYVLPASGGLGWTDTFMIPKNAVNKTGANMFINFMLKPEIAAMVIDKSGFNTTVTGALDLTKAVNKDLYRFSDEQVANLKWSPNWPGSVLSSITSFWEEISTGK
jgi:spermidine/putrescine transport system substrate-binding protein